MFNKFLYGLLSTVLVIGMLLVPSVYVNADENLVNEYLVDDCETPFGGMTLDTTDKTEGNASLSFTFNTKTMADEATESQSLFFIQKRYEKPVNVGNSTAFTFDLYVSSLSFIDQINSGQIEVTSSGVCDEEEMSWGLPGSFKNLKKGWNHLELEITEKVFHKERFNYFRIYMWFNIGKAQDKDITIKFDNMKFKEVNYLTNLCSFDGTDALNSTKKLMADTNGKYEGESSIKWQLDPSADTGFRLEGSFEKKDISKCSSVVFYLYVSNPKFINEWSKSLTFRISSRGEGKLSYYEWDVLTQIYPPLEVGWNRVALNMKTAELYGAPDRENITGFEFVLSDLSSQDTDLTTFRIDGLYADIDSFDMHIGVGTQDYERISKGREYDDDDRAPQNLSGNSGTTRPGTMLEEADSKDTSNTYNTDHAKVVAVLTVSVLISISTVVVCVIVVKRIRKES